MASNFSIRHAAHIVHHGGIIAYPTDTIYGLGCDPNNVEAVEKLNQIKQRPLNKQFILLAGEFAQLQQLVSITRQQRQTISSTTMPTSWIVNAAPGAPEWLVSNDGTITIRISRHDEVQRLCKALGHAIISTSANISGKPPATSALQLHKYFHHKVDKILVYNKPQNAKPSRIIRLCDNKLIRN